MPRRSESTSPALRSLPAHLLRPVRRPRHRPNFLPLLAERFARQRLHALARVEGKIIDGKPTVLFLCAHNAGRSQMALGYFNHLAGDNAIAWSGGSEPGTRSTPPPIAAMAEVGIDITGEYPKPWTDEIVRAADVVITMGCGDACPIFPGNATRTGNSPTPPAKVSTPSGPSATTSKNASTGCWPNSTSPNPMTAKTQGNTTIRRQPLPNLQSASRMTAWPTLAR